MIAFFHFDGFDIWRRSLAMSALGLASSATLTEGSSWLNWRAIVQGPGSAWMSAIVSATASNAKARPSPDLERQTFLLND